MSTQAILQVKNLKKSFDNKLILDNINMEVHHNEFICILGSSGSGKSTLIECIAGFTPIEDGEIRLEGQKITKPSAQMIAVFQDFNQLFPWKTIEDNIKYPLKVRNRSLNKEELSQKATKALEFVNLSGEEKKYPKELSGGMKQRAAVARALALEPKILLMDEPFGSLDAITRKELQKNLKQITKEVGLTIIFVTHDIDEALYLSNRIFLFDLKQRKLNEISKEDFKRDKIEMLLEQSKGLK